LGLFLVVLAIGVGCNDDDDDNGGNFVVADKVYNQAFNCSQTPTGGTAFCADANATGQVQITNLGGGNWEVREVPDSGFVATGTWTGRTFNFTATNPAGFTETGSWSFSESGNSFSGSSSYVADNNAFTGECTIHGAVVPNIPPDADPIGACL
jgi:hypothetical protein